VEPEPDPEETDIYSALNGNTLAFFYTQSEAEKYADSAEHVYRNIRGESYTRGWKKPPNTPWIGEADKIEVINFATEIVPTSLACYFSDLKSLKRIENMQNLNTTIATSMNGLFAECISLEELNLESFDTKKVTDMNSMFSSCSNIKELVLTN